MPIFLEPGQSFPVVLDCDKDKPAETRPTFYVRSQSMRGQKRILEVLDRLSTDESVTVDDLFSDAVNVLSDVIVRWTNMNNIELSKEAMLDVLTYQEARELLRKVAYNQHVTTDEKKD